MAASDAVPPGPSTPSSIFATCVAVLFDRIRFPGFRSPSTTYGRCMIPPFAMALYAWAIWIGVTAMPWPIGRLPIEEPEYCFGGSTMPGLSPGRSTPVAWPQPKARAPQIEACRLAEAEVPHPLVEAGRAQLHADLDRSDVRGLRQDPRDRERLVAMVLRVLDRAVGDLDLGRDRERRARRYESLLQGAGDRDRLEGRAGLV